MASILFAGDFCPHGRVHKIIANEDYGFLFDDIKGVVTEADYSIVNFETTIADSKADKAIVKSGPALCTNEKAIDALKYAGFSCCSLANNHFNDYGRKGIDNTIRVLHQNGLDRVGAGDNLKEAGEVLYKEVDGKSIAIISCCEHEFSIAASDMAGCNPLDPAALFYSISEAKRKAEYVFLIVHGGLEHIQVPQPRMKELYRYFIDIGVDVVINHHQHCFNGMEVYNGKPIFYGLGNFCFDWEGKRNSIWNYGYMVRINLNGNLSYEVIPYKQCDIEPKVSLLVDAEREKFDKEFQALSDIIQDDDMLQKMNEDFFRGKVTQYRWIFEPYSGRIFTGLYFRKILPSFAKKNLSEKQNFIECESHREALLKCIKNKWL